MNVSVQYQIRGDSSNLIAASIENGIRGGKVRVGERLPTVRALAIKLRVSPTTVAAAYSRQSPAAIAHARGLPGASARAAQSGGWRSRPGASSAAEAVSRAT